MLDRKWIRENPKQLTEALAKRKVPQELLQELIRLEEKRILLKKEVEQITHEKKLLSESIGQLIKEGKAEEGPKSTIQALTLKIKSAEEQMVQCEEQINPIWMGLPNLFDEKVPPGISEQDNVIVREWGKIPSFSFVPKAHWEIGSSLGWIDFDRGAKLGGSKFVLLQGQGAELSRKLGSFMLENAIKRGYREINPPIIGKEAIFEGSGQLPKFEEDLYQLPERQFLIPTGEVPLVNLYREEIVAEEALPLKLTCLTPCFRREAGAAGKETRGLIRVHQFEKVELVQLTKPEDSQAALESIVASAEDVLQQLGLAYRVMLLCTEDLTTFSSSITYDLEVWFPSMNRYVEISSCSNCKDFQARRASIRFRNQAGQVQFVHTLNGSGLAVGRCLAALMENYQTQDGSVQLPDNLPFSLMKRD